jgi:hypothetical protein
VTMRWPVVISSCSAPAIYFGALSAPSNQHEKLDFNGSVRDRLFEHLLALAAFECAKIKTEWAGRDPHKHHSRLAARAAGPLDCP